MDFGFRGDCQPQKFKTLKINAHVFLSESRKFGNAKIFQYRVTIHVIFSSSQIGKFGISQREIGVLDREIFVG